MTTPELIDQDGNPLRIKRMGAPVITPPYTAADRFSQELGAWHPMLQSPDADYLPGRDIIVARSRDLVRNSGWASSALTRHLDNVIGTGFRLSAKPDYVTLGQSYEWAAEWGEQVEGLWASYAEDPDFYIDATRNNDFHGMLRVAYRHYVADGDALAVALWKEGKLGGQAATTIKLIHPDRLCNPHGTVDTNTLRGGVELDEDGAAIAYWMRKAHLSDAIYMGADAYEWERVARETEWGRRLVIHAFDTCEVGRSRGVSRFAPIVERFKMIDKYDKIELQAALINAIFSAYIESPMDHELLMDSMEDGSLTKYQKDRADFHDTRKLQLGGMRLQTLFPGESIKLQTATRPNVAFEAFERACLRNIAAAMGITYEQLTQDWSQVNYSSARAGMLEIWKTLSADRDTFATKFATPIYQLWLEEMINAGRIKIPRSAPDYYEAKAAYGNVRWIGAARGYVDPEKEAKAENMRLNNMTSTLEDECAAQGKDWREVLRQRARENREMAKLNMGLPDWASVPQSSSPPSGE